MRLMLAFLLLMSVPAFAAPPAAVISDPPPDKAHPAGMHYVQIPSHGALLNGVLYTASGAGPHPALLFLHGFPGNEQNLDLAQAVRRAGFNVLTLHYRGSWGSPGVFKFAQALEDSDAALAFLHANAGKFHIGRIFVAGHSMGGWMAASATAHDPAVAGTVLISAADMGLVGTRLHDKAYRKAQMDAEFRDDVIPLAGTTADTLMDELQAHGAGWTFAGLAPALHTRPVLLVTSDDGLAPDAARLAGALRPLGGKVAEIHMATDHPYSDHRIALESAVVGWLEKQVSGP